jgi:hypothetical protein
MPIFPPTSKYKVLECLKREGRTDFLETLGGSYDSTEGRTTCFNACAIDSSRPML